MKENVSEGSVDSSISQCLVRFLSLCNNSCFPLAEGKLLYQLYFLLVQYLCVTRSYFAPTEKWGIHSQLLVDTKRSKKEP